MSAIAQVDDELRQDGNTSDMVHKIPSLIAIVSRVMTLEEGDVIITGTPEGVGPVPPNSVRSCRESSVRAELYADSHCGSRCRS